MLAAVTDVTPKQEASPTPRSGEPPAGSIGPKVRAACSFVEQTGGLELVGAS
jgi:carbamate kinase